MVTCMMKKASSILFIESGLILGFVTLFVTIGKLLMGLLQNTAQISGQSGISTQTMNNIGWWELGILLALAGATGLLSYLYYYYRNNTQTQLKQYLRQSITYTKRIENFLAGSSNRQEQLLLLQIKRWRENIEKLIEELSLHYQNQRLQQNLDDIQQNIVTLETQLATNLPPGSRLQLEVALQGYYQQRLTLQQAELQVQATVGLLNKIYGHLLNTHSTPYVVDYYRLLTDVNEEVNCLEAYVVSLYEVKASSQFLNIANNTSKCRF